MPWDNDYTSAEAQGRMAVAEAKAKQVRDSHGFTSRPPRKRLNRALQADRDSDEGKARSRYLDNLLRRKLGMPTLPVKLKEREQKPAVRVGKTNPRAGEHAMGRGRRSW